MRRVRALVVMFCFFTVSAGVWCLVEAEDTSPKKKEAVAGEPHAEKKATLSLKAVADNKIKLELVNSVPVRGIQCTIRGVRLREVRTTTRTAGFFAKFNEETGIVIIVSTAGDEIAPGKGPVAEVIGEKIPGEEPSLSQVMLADTNRQLL